jgi:hypothetical protein
MEFHPRRRSVIARCPHDGLHEHGLVELLLHETPQKDGGVHAIFPHVKPIMDRSDRHKFRGSKCLGVGVGGGVGRGSYLPMLSLQKFLFGTSSWVP